MHFKQAPYITFVIGAKVPRGSVPKALYWDTLDPYHYVRLQSIDEQYDVLIVGGEDLTPQPLIPSPQAGGETKHSFGGVGFFGFNKQSSGHDMRGQIFINVLLSGQTAHFFIVNLVNIRELLVLDYGHLIPP